MSLARATVSGVIVSEPEKRFTNNNFAVTNFTLQVTPGGRNETPFMVRVTCWRALADVVADTLHKGDEATVEGRLQVNQYDAPGGATKRTYEIDASNVYRGQLQALVSANEGQQQGGQYQAPSQPSGSTGESWNQSPQPVPVAAGSPLQQAPESFSQEDLLTENDIPF